MNVELFTIIMLAAMAATCVLYLGLGLLVTRRKLRAQKDIAMNLRCVNSDLWKSHLKQSNDNLKLNINTGELLSELAVHADEIRRLNKWIAELEAELLKKGRA